MRDTDEAAAGAAVGGGGGSFRRPRLGARPLACAHASTCRERGGRGPAKLTVLDTAFRGRHLPAGADSLTQPAYSLSSCAVSAETFGEDRLPFLSVFQDQRSRAGLGFGSAGFLLRAFHGCVPFLVGTGPCSRHGSAGDFRTGSDQRTAAGVTRDRHELSAQQLSFLGLGNERELTVAVVDHLDVFRSGGARRRRSQAPLKSRRISHEGKPKPFGRRLAERQPLPLRVGDGVDGDIPFRREGLFYPKQVARVRPLPRLQLSDQVGGDLPAAIGQRPASRYRARRSETYDIRSLPKSAGRSITSIDWPAREVFQRSLVLSRVVDTAIFVSDPSDDSVGRLHPGLGLEPYPDRFARVQGLGDLWSEGDVKTLAVSSLDRREYLSGQLIVQTLAKHDTFEGRCGQLLDRRPDSPCALSPTMGCKSRSIRSFCSARRVSDSFHPSARRQIPGGFSTARSNFSSGLEPSHAIPPLRSRVAPAVSCSVYLCHRVRHGHRGVDRSW